MAQSNIRALDLFAGTGWGVAAQWMGIEEYGVEIMPEAIATRAANGMTTIFEDVWDGLVDPEKSAMVSRLLSSGLLRAEQRETVDGLIRESWTEEEITTLLIASPPCQTFSLAGKGAGRAALDEVLEAIELHAYKDPEELIRFGGKHDPRTALVLAPLAYIYRDRPDLVALEQVPAVLPVWEACAAVMADWGYDVKTAVLNAEQYGVPQTRKRAILVASRIGEVKLPTPTHSRYYSRDPKHLDPGVLPWVSMAEALGWCPPGAAGFPRLSDGRGEVEIDGTAYRARDLRDTSHPAQAVTEKARSWKHFQGGGAEPVTVEEASALQSYPVYRNGNQAHASRRALDQPAPTVHFGARSNKVEWMDPELAADPAASGQRVTVEEASTLQSFPPKPFVWCGTKTKKFLQIGNAVPPVLARAILSALIND